MDLKEPRTPRQSVQTAWLTLLLGGGSCLSKAKTTDIVRSKIFPSPASAEEPQVGVLAFRKKLYLGAIPMPGGGMPF